MRKIDKTNIKSTQYDEWLKDNKGNHPKYDSKYKHYKDIKMSLLYSQDGLCAYTEERLCDKKLIEDSCWSDGKYQNNQTDSLVNGDLEHFDNTLKDKQAYLWDNLFIVNSNINSRVKCSKEIYDILKPDSSHYDENKYLEFNYENNLFIANPKLSENEQKDVECMIQTLGINHNGFKRKEQISRLLNEFKYYNMTLSKPDEYLTSWNMTLKQLENNKN